MQNTLQTAPSAAEDTDPSGDPPRAKIDLTDALTLIPRFFAGFFMTGLAVLYATQHDWRMVAFLGIAGSLMLYWGYRLVMKIRGENTAYIAHRAAVEAAERAAKRDRGRAATS